MTITNSQMTFLGFSLRNPFYNFMGNEGIYVGKGGEESYKIPAIRAFHELLASQSSHELFAKHIDTELLACASHLTFHKLMQSRASRE